MQDLLKIAHQNPQLARARATLESHAGEIIDGADMIRLAERELMSPLDAEARRLVSSAAQRSRSSQRSRPARRSTCCSCSSPRCA